VFPKPFCWLELVSSLRELAGLAPCEWPGPKADPGSSKTSQANEPGR
jgi:hypothetical protein